MPKLDTSNPEVREFILKVMFYWIDHYGIDGWRLDVADEVDPSVWAEARIRIKEKYPDKILLGETWGYAGKMLIDSHDTERFLYLCREDKTLLKLAVAFQILFPGSPAIYYGDEVGMTGDNDPDCRRCMEWGENADKDVKNWYQKMIQLRKNYSCIRSGSFRIQGQNYVANGAVFCKSHNEFIELEQKTIGGCLQ